MKCREAIAALMIWVVFVAIVAIITESSKEPVDTQETVVERVRVENGE